MSIVINGIDMPKGYKTKILLIYSDGRVFTGCKDGINYFAEELPSADVQPVVRWIPCSERLPDVAQRVLLSGHGQVMVGMLHSFGKYSLEPTGISHVYPKDDIEAWMPLPEPYLEGADNVD